MPRWSQVHIVRQIHILTRSKWAHAAAALLTLLFVLPVAALAQGSPFDTGFNAIQGLFTGTIAKVASLVAIVIGGYGFAHGEPGAKKALAVSWRYPAVVARHQGCVGDRGLQKRRRRCPLLRGEWALLRIGLAHKSTRRNTLIIRSYSPQE